jgi:hypothetical protein
MPLLFNFCNLNNLCLPEIIIYIIAGLGTVLIIYSQFVEAEFRRDLIRLTGAAAVFIYAFLIENMLFMVLCGGIFIAALVEFIEIYLGVHKHKREDIVRYKSLK